MFDWNFHCSLAHDKYCKKKYGDQNMSLAGRNDYEIKKIEELSTQWICVLQWMMTDNLSTG